MNLEQAGVWTRLFPRALLLMEELERRSPGAIWTFGGGTVLMLRIAHRQSKDIDLFVPDPQYLGYVNPRLSDVAASVSSEYEEAAEFIKLFLDEGEIDIVAGQHLTDDPFEFVEFGGRPVRVENSAEIIAKKFWHRGNQAKGRDLFDLCAVADARSDEIELAKPYMQKHGAAFLERLAQRADVVKAELGAIDAMVPVKSFEEYLAQARDIIQPLLVKK